METMAVLSSGAQLTPELRKFTYRDLLDMERTGIIGEDEHIELLGGQIYKMTIKPPHAMAVSILTQKFSVAFDGRAQIIPQNPLRLSDDLNDTELPQPDVMLVQNQLYLDHPRPENVLLLVEVSDNTLHKDQTLKLPLYAQVGIPELWIVNLIQRRLEVYTEPKGDDYQHRVFHDLTATLAPSAFPDTLNQWLPEDIHTILDQQ
ncbi:MAG: Uma2 family endonuclease [Candidatus Tectomicrobia bacterium]|nr:Uma2 family endonuclease [Candidatus Tectomicrobia bacterium]